MNMRSKSTLDKINRLARVPMEEWHRRGVTLRAASASSSGFINSGITSDGVYFFRQGDRFIIEKRDVR